jgi:hypothetical protein
MFAGYDPLDEAFRRTGNGLKRLANLEKTENLVASVKVACPNASREAL